MKKIKFFAFKPEEELTEVEDRINNWQKDNEVEIVDVRIAAAAPSHSPKSDGMHVHVTNVIIAVLYHEKK